ncbi:MAG TPA: ABC transporter ATP-binding protein [Burkholderiales bacterium]|nr:ABC transporter ATP-binding protein [Burkholderiales bacterium]
MKNESVPIRLQSVAKTFADGTRALEPLELEIAAGETLVLLGPSGCGKTTLLRIISGLEAPDAGGRVLFGDADVTALPIERRNVGMVFQSYALFPNMNVAENVGYGLRVRSLDRKQLNEKVDELLSLVQLDGYGERRVDQLSGGQRQRVALARALAVRPRALLLDEPLTALDAKLREQLRADIDRLLRSLAITAVYVTHDQSEAMALGDRVAVMERGCIAQIGTPREVYHRPRTAFVADFIGTMNRMHLAPGAPESLFRPEDTRIVGAAEAQFSGRIVSVFFLGDHTRLMVDCGSSQPLTVETVERREFRQGETLHLAVAPEAVVTL